MTKSYDEQIADLQKKISDIKAKKAKEEKQKIQKIGQAVADHCPDILKKMEEDGFNIFEFVKTREFTNLLYATLKKEEEKRQPEAVQQVETVPQVQPTAWNGQQ